MQNLNYKYLFFYFLIFPLTASPSQNKIKIALGGYDVVSYFTENKAAPGKEKFSFKYRDRKWLFSSSNHLELFKNNPEKYIPAYGGYCAWAAGERNRLYPGDPNIFLIYKNKLYMNNNPAVHKKWLLDKDSLIKKADEFWKTTDGSITSKLND